MHPLVETRNEKRLLLGNEAIVRGALEAGVGFVSTYPGTPSSEIGDTFFRLHGDAGIGFEYSVNEKVALEVAGATAAAGVPTLVAMKHVGVNVAADPLMTLSYMGVPGGLVLVTADDPGCHSSQNEQDNRHYARLGKLPMLEPATPDEAHRLVQEAFRLSREHETPVLFRITTRVAHTRGVVELGTLPTPRIRGDFQPDKRRFTPIPAVARLRHPVVEENLKRIESQFVASPLNRLTNREGSFGVLTSGVAACYVDDALARLELTDRVKLLHLVTTHPVPRDLLADFLEGLDAVLVVEELDPILEGEIRQAVARAGRTVPVYGKESGHFSLVGELGPDVVTRALGELLAVPVEFHDAGAVEGLPGRPPILCPGCPHRATYAAVKLAVGDEAMYLSDIGCYTLGFLPPIGMGDYFICMGSSASSAGGFAATTDKPVVSFIGDSTFFHSGVTGLINSVHNQRDLLLVVLDNRTTGMTGHQPHPGTEHGDKQAVEIAAMARAAGIEHIATIDPSHQKLAWQTINELLAKDGPKVLISESPCPLYARKALGKKSAPLRYRIDQDACKYCGREKDGLRCDLDPHREYGLARTRARVLGGPEKLGAFVMDAPPKMETPPCEAACPLGLCVQGYVGHIAAGQLDRARQLIRQRLVLPHSVCRVCHQPCQDVCIRGDVDDPIAINALKRYAMDRESAAELASNLENTRAVLRDNGRKVAVIGAGPSGLACAFDLRFRGYQVHVFEKEGKPGGMLEYAIPAYRLPREALQRDLDFITGLGVVIHTNTALGEKITLKQLRKDGFAACYLATGQPAGAKLGVPGEDMPAVDDALSFLRRVTQHEPVDIAGSVLVVGGGNSAIDAARAARRLGADEIKLVYRRTREQMPAIAHEVEAALAEGIELLELTVPEGFAEADRGLSVTCRKMKLGEADSSGRARPMPTHETQILPTDHVIIAIGQSAALMPEHVGAMKLDRWGRPVIDPATGAGDDPFLFAGGDVVTGPASVVEAMQAGKYAAYGIDRLLNEDPDKVIVEAWRDREKLLSEPRYQPVKVPPMARTTARLMEPEQAVHSFAEVELGLDDKAARDEAARCLACGKCAACNTCLDNFGCPAFYREDGRVQINPILCDGCGVCVQICPNGAIVPVPA